MADNLAILRAFYDAMAVGDVPAVEALLDHERLVVREAPSLPFGGEYRGIEGFREVARKLAASWKRVSFTDFSYAIGDDLVMAHFTMTATGRPTGQEVSFTVTEVWRFSGGKVVLIEPYYQDTHAVRGALGLAA